MLVLGIGPAEAFGCCYRVCAGRAGDYIDSSGTQRGLLLTGAGTSWTATKARAPPRAVANPQVSIGSMSCASATAWTVVGTYSDSFGHTVGLLLTGSRSCPR